MLLYVWWQEQPKFIFLLLKMFGFFLHQDYYATGNSMPLLDTHQSYTLLSLSESEGQTVMTFQRSIQTCDNQDLQITVRQCFNSLPTTF